MFCFISSKLIVLLFLGEFIFINTSPIFQGQNYEAKIEGPKKIMKEILLNSYFKLDCALNISNEFKFEKIIFNRSISDLDGYNMTISKDNTISASFISIKSQEKFQKLFKKIDKFWTNNEITIKSSKFNDSGSYYCIYSKENSYSNNIEYLVSSYLYLIYEDVTIVKNFKETAELDACVDNPKENQIDLNYIQWYNNADNDYTDNYMSLNPKTNSLVIRLDDVQLFYIIYQCHNSLSGAFKIYRLECSNCDGLLSAPLISPTRQIVYEGADTQFSCEKPQNTNEPDRYQWFKQNSEIYPDYNEKFNMSLSVGHGPLLDLKNLTKSQAGWYICCLIKSQSSAESKRYKLNTDEEDYNIDETDYPNFSCSSVELKILDSPIIKKPRNNLIIYLLTSICVTTIFVMLILIYFCSRKLKTFKYDQKETVKMQDNDFYDDKNISSGSSLDHLIENEEELKNFKEILKSSSSIEELLNEDQVRKWKIDIENLRFGNVVGRGAFGIVVQAILKKNIPILKRDADSGLDSYTYIPNEDEIKTKTKHINVAVKKLPETATQKNFYDLFKELQLMINVGEHQHIVNLIGYSIENTSLYIVTDYAKYGNLKDFLRKYSETGSSKIGAEYLLLYSYQIALGMEYLHSKKILHRDLAARNILVDDYNSVKIADFGLARDIHTNYYYVQKLNGKVPFKWMSPEAIKFQKISKESDVWSYGVLLWEIFTYGCTPYPTLQLEEILEKLISGYRMEKPKDCDQFIYDNIMKICWDIDPKNRLSFKELVEKYETLLNKHEYSSTKELMEELKHKNENSNLIDEETSYHQLKKPKPSESDCSIMTEMKYGLNVPNCLTSSSSSFNQSSTLSTHTTTTTDSHSIDKEIDLKNNDNKNQFLTLNKTLISIDNTSLMKKFSKQNNKSIKNNPIYNENCILEFNQNIIQTKISNDDNGESQEKNKRESLKNIITSFFKSENLIKKNNIKRVLMSDV